VSQDGRIGIRAVPLAEDRLADWAVSQRARATLEQAARDLARRSDDVPLDEPAPFASGLIVGARSDNLLEPLRPGCSGLAITATDAAGVVVASIQLSPQQPILPPTTMTLNGFRNVVIRPLLDAITRILGEAEIYGRSLLELRLGSLENVIRLSDQSGPNVRGLPSGLPVGGEIALPLSPGALELDALADQWRDDVAREAGYLKLRP
jgi:hypothetical protein